MKKMSVLIVALCATLAVVGCKSAPLPSASTMMEEARNGAPDGTLIGQATATIVKGSSKDEALKKSETSAKSQLIRAMVSMAKDMVDEAVAAGTMDYNTAEEFRLGVNANLSRSNINGAQKAGQDEAANGVCWTVLYMQKSDVVKEINEAVNASKVAFPGAAAFSTEEGINKAFNVQAAKEWKN
jgi:hypothetical protein